MHDFETAKQFFFEGLRLLEANEFQEAEELLEQPGKWFQARCQSSTIQKSGMTA